MSLAQSDPEDPIIHYSLNSIKGKDFSHKDIRVSNLHDKDFNKFSFRLEPENFH